MAEVRDGNESVERPCVISVRGTDILSGVNELLSSEKLNLEGGLAMARKTKWTVALSPEERDKLQELRRRSTVEQRLALRVRMILMAGDGAGLAETSRALDVLPQVVAKWRRRWIERAGQSVEERLSDAPRSGAPATFTAEQIRRRLRKNSM